MLLNQKTLVEEAKESRILPNILTAVLWSLAFLFLGSFIGIIPEILTTLFYESSPLITSLSTLIYGSVCISLLVFVRVKLVEKRSFSSIGFSKEKFIRKYLIGFVVGLFMISVSILILYFTGHIELNSTFKSPSGLAAIIPILLILPGWIIQSGAEEIIARGWLMNTLGAKYNIAVGLSVSSMFFGLLHLGNLNVNILAIINLILTGLFLGIYVIKSNNLWGVCGLHAAWNWAQGNIYGFQVSGTSEITSVGSFFHFKFTGSNFITGGSFGPEAGIAVTIVLLLGLLVLIFLPYLKKSK